MAAVTIIVNRVTSLLPYVRGQSRRTSLTVFVQEFWLPMAATWCDANVLSTILFFTGVCPTPPLTPTFADLERRWPARTLNSSPAGDEDGVFSGRPANVIPVVIAGALWIMDV